MVMSRKEQRELREVRAAEAALAGVLVNWGIEMDEGDPTIQGFAFAKQIGEEEAVEYHEVYAMLRDIALEAYSAGRQVTDVPLLAEYRPLRAEIDDLPYDRNIPVTEDAWKREHVAYEGGWDYSELSKGRKPRLVAVEWTDPTETPSETMRRFDEETKEAWLEVKRLRDIIKAAYSNQGWDIGSVKNLLIAGLEGYENTGWAKLHEKTPHVHEKWQLQESAQGGEYCAACGEAVRTHEAPIYTETSSLSFAPESSRDGWWLYLNLIDDHDEEIAVLILNDQDASKLSDSLAERVREGRKDWS